MSGVLPRELRLDGDIADSIYRIAFGPPRTQTACPPGTLLSCIERTCKISCKCFAVNAGLSVLASGESITLNEIRPKREARRSTALLLAQITYLEWKFGRGTAGY
jgi:hypothetical protein